MPRPGPRPYECVRRAWHSDRHHPMRGSLIQEIFRVVSEAHKLATRRNREWQEKLPCVVLKAEEIMYSKANSEAEYMELTTLWQRVNEAVDTIIRRDQHADDETPVQLLHPCIEAALNLGCVPRRASRSQRNNNPISYLNSISRGPAAAPVNSELSQNKNSTIKSLPSPQLSCPSTCQTSAAQFTSSCSRSMNAHQFAPIVSFDMGDSLHNTKKEVALPGCHSTFLCQDTNLPVEKGSCAWSSSARVYPLYYSDSQSETGSFEPSRKCQEVLNMPGIIKENSFVLHNLVAKEKMDANSGLKGNSTNLHSLPCDLSLCLGLSSTSYSVAENTRSHAVADVMSSNSCEVSKSSDQSADTEKMREHPWRSVSVDDRCLDLFPKDSSDDHLESCSSKWSSEGEGISNAGLCDRKRKQRADENFYGENLHWKNRMQTYQLGRGTQVP